MAIVNSTSDPKIKAWVDAKFATARQIRRAHKARRLSVQKAVEAKNADKASLIVKRRPAHLPQ